jgi:hypothetical protein
MRKEGSGICRCRRERSLDKVNKKELQPDGSPNLSI